MRSEDLKVKLLPVTLGEVAGVCPRKPQRMAGDISSAFAQPEADAGALKRRMLRHEISMPWHATLSANTCQLLVHLLSFHIDRS